MRVLITGGTGMVGSAFKSQQTKHDLVFVGSSEYDLVSWYDTMRMVENIRPNAIIHLAAKVGGVKANIENQGDFYTINTMINTNVLRAAKNFNVNKVVSLLSTCVYPDLVNYPLTEDQIHNGPPHISNFGYAYAKRMLDIQSRAYRDQHGCNFITAVPNNLFGEYDNFDLQNSHVIPAIIRKIHEAKLDNKDVILWGDGSPIREFTYSKDLAKILLFLLENYNDPYPINIGNNQQISIKKVAFLISEILNFNGKIVWDTTKPKGQFKKPSNNSKIINLGWKEENYTNFEKALTDTCKWFIINYPKVRGI